MATSSLAGKRAVESIVVFKAGEVLAADGAALTLAGGDVNLNDGQVGVFQYNGTTSAAAPLGTALDHTTASGTTDAVKKIQLFQGTANSASISTSARYPMAARPYNKSSVIDLSRVNSSSYQPYQSPRLSTWTLGDVAGATGAITPVDETEYSLKIAFRGRRVDETKSSVHGRPSFTPSYTTPNYTALGTTDPLDDLIKNLGFVINRNSILFNFVNPSFGGGQEVVAFAVNTSGTTTGVTLTAASSAGVTIPTVVFDGITRNVVTTQEMADTIADLVTAAPGAVDGLSEIVPIDLSTAGSAADADVLIIMGVDEYDIGFDDRIPQKKIRLDIGLFEGFNYPQVDLVEAVRAKEGEGSYRQMKLLYDRTAGQRWYSQNRSEWPVLPNGDSAFTVSGEYGGTDLLVPGTNYDMFIIHSDDFAVVDGVGPNVVSPKTTYVLVPTGEAVVGNIQTLFAALGL